MSINYKTVLSAVVARLKVDATVDTNIGTVGTPETPCVFVMRAPAAATSEKPTIVVHRNNSTDLSSFDLDGERIRFDVHLYFGKGAGLDPGANGTDCFAMLAAMKVQLKRWVPSVTGMTCSAVWYDNEIDAHDDETWHWVQSYTVHCTST